MKTASPIRKKRKPATLEKRVAALEADVAALRAQAEHAEIMAAVEQSEAEFDRGEGIPAREALEQVRRKFNKL